MYSWPFHNAHGPGSDIGVGYWQCDVGGWHFGVPRFARVVRGTSAKEQYVFSSVIGCRHLRIVFRHILPNVVDTIVLRPLCLISSCSQ